MPKTNEYHLWIHSSFGNGGGGRSNPVANNKTSGGSRNAKRGGSTDDSTGAKLLSKLVSYAAIKGIADKTIGYQISQITARTGAVEYQQRMQTVYSTVSSGLGFIVSEIAIASVNAPLAIANVGEKAIEIGIEAAQRIDQINTGKVVEGISLSYAKIRAGASGRRSSGGDTWR